MKKLLLIALLVVAVTFMFAVDPDPTFPGYNPGWNDTCGDTFEEASATETTWSATNIVTDEFLQCDATLTFTLLPQIACYFPDQGLADLCIEDPTTFNSTLFYIRLKKNCYVSLSLDWYFYFIKSGSQLPQNVQDYFLLYWYAYEPGNGIPTEWLDMPKKVTKNTTIEMIRTAGDWQPPAGYNSPPPNIPVTIWNCDHTLWFGFYYNKDFGNPCDWAWCTELLAGDYKIEVFATIHGYPDP